MSDSKHILEQSQLLQKELEEKRHYLHQHPEVGFELNKTRDFVVNELKNMGYNPQLVGKCGVVVTIKGKDNKKCIMLRADMDALNMKEEAELPFASVEENRMHGCGHDLHTTMLLGAAKILKEYENKLDGTIKLVFQPAEEIFQGSLDMMENGILENPKVDAALMIHVIAGMPLPTGCFMVPSCGGIMMNTCEQYRIRVNGKGGHGSMPHNAIDPITAAAQIHLALQEINSRELRQDEYGVFTTGKFVAGSASNVIPDFACMEGTIRTADEDRSVNQKIKARITEISKGVASALRCEAEVEFSDFCPCMKIDDTFSKQVFTSMKDLFGQEVVPMQPSPGGGSEDFSFVSHKVPVSCMFLSAGSSKDGYTYGQHHPRVIYDESCLYLGSAAYAYVAIDYLKAK